MKTLEGITPRGAKSIVDDYVDGLISEEEYERRIKAYKYVKRKVENSTQ